MRLRGLVFCLQTRKIFKPWLLYKLQGKIFSTWFDDLLAGIGRCVHRWTSPNGFWLGLWFLWILMGPSKIFWYFGEFFEYNVNPSKIVPSSPCCFCILHVWSLVWILMGDLRISETSTSLQWSKKIWCQHQVPNWHASGGDTTTSRTRTRRWTQYRTFTESYSRWEWIYLSKNV